MKQFLFLYPIPEYFNSEIGEGAYRLLGRYGDDELAEKIQKSAPEEKERIVEERLCELKEEFQRIYRTNLNVCIDLRYRQRGFRINYALFDGSPVSDLVNLQESDRIIRVGMDFKTHTTKQTDGKYPYPDQDYILNQLGEIKVITVSGFHMWSWVEKLARRAYERGIDTLVDEDLTEFLSWQMMRESFRTDQYPSYNPKTDEEGVVDLFMESRKDKPWLWQDY